MKKNILNLHRLIETAGNIIGIVRELPETCVNQAESRAITVRQMEIGVAVTNCLQSTKIAFQV